MATGMFRAASQQWYGRTARMAMSLAQKSNSTMPFMVRGASALRTASSQKVLRPVLCASFHSSPFRLSSEQANLMKEPPVITADTITVGGKTYPKDAFSNVTPTILEKTSRQLHLIPTHPIAIIKDLIASTFPDFKHYDTFSPVVTTKENFDDLLFADDHPGRAVTDTYYVNEKIMLRTHTSAHQLKVMTESDKILVTADVYRRDEIDASHYPVFHQMEGAQLFDVKTVVEDIKALTARDLAHSLNLMIRRLFSHEKDLQVRWIDATFPFTSPSWEMEILYQGKWLEVLGCGVIRQDILKNAGKPDKIGWAFGLGLERLALVLFGIPDIRLFWSQDERFLKQFQPSQIQKFKPFSKYPACIKDIS
ncbi:hypothetical protein BGZ59_010835, partial [Podila verticillata]